ncbi:MFS transporter [Chachezhania sediminis]|uniref:MFS transporter n=1 Tax=Chachezhania sediminis TaxID=2599291 RepID=UPI00131D3CEF|nr:MFS transporter [Chachezhania sediminis]
MTHATGNGAMAPAGLSLDEAGTAPNPRPILIVLSLANFVVGMGAFMILGMMVPLAEAFDIDPKQGAWMMTLYSLTYAVASPVLISLTGQMGRRRVLTLGLVLFGAASILTAFAQTPLLLFAGRPLAAAGAGLVTPVAAAVAAAMVEPERRARALSSVFLGMTLAQVLGVPAGSFVAYTFGWQVAFWFAGLLSLAGAVLVWNLVPAGLIFAPVSLADLARLMSNRRMMMAVLFTTLFLGAVNMMFMLLAPMLDAVMGFGRNGIMLVLLVAGLGAVFGNALGGQMTDRLGYYRTLLVMVPMVALLSMPFSLMPFPVAPVAILAALIFLQSSCSWAAMPAQQVRLISMGPQIASVILGLNAGAIYIGGAVGSALGVGVVSVFGFQGLGVAVGLGLIPALILLILTERLRAPGE